MTARFRTLIDNIISFGEASAKVGTALIIGSQARTDHPADDYSDLDIVLLTEELDWFIENDQWLKDIGSYHISFTENSLAGGRERRILFDGALDVDFIILPIESVTHVDIARILGRGYSILIDKIGVHDSLSQLAATPVHCYSMPTEQDFRNIVNDFWYHAV